MANNPTVPTPPQPSWRYASFGVLALAAFWAVGIFFGLPGLIASVRHLLIAAIAWSIVMGWLTLHGLAGFRTELCADGVRKHGFFRDKWIEWRDARAHIAGGWAIRVSSDTQTIIVNPYAYVDPRQVAIYIAERTGEPSDNRVKP